MADVEVQEVDRGYYRFTVIASGSSPLSYTWYINDTIQNSCRSYVSCTLSMHSFGGGRTKIQVQVANYDGMGMRHSANSTLIILLGEPYSITLNLTPSAYLRIWQRRLHIVSEVM